MPDYFCNSFETNFFFFFPLLPGSFLKFWGPLPLGDLREGPALSVANDGIFFCGSNMRWVFNFKA